MNWATDRLHQEFRAFGLQFSRRALSRDSETVSGRGTRKYCGRSMADVQKFQDGEGPGGGCRAAA